MVSISKRPVARSLFAAALLTASASVLAQSARSPSAPPPAAPPESATQPPKAAPDMQKVLDALAGLGSKPIETLTPAQARMQPSAADGAKAAMAQQGMSTAPDASVTTQDVPYGSDAQQFARIYKPAAAPANGKPMPVVVYYHGGGWVIADVNTYDSAPRAMAKALNAIVVSVEYRHAPEFKFPAQHDDAAAAYRWTLQNAASWGGDPAKIALAGESAGGNLAVATAIFAGSPPQLAAFCNVQRYAAAASSCCAGNLNSGAWRYSTDTTIALSALAIARGAESYVFTSAMTQPPP